MAITKSQKKKIVDDLIERINKSKSIVFVNFDKLGVKDSQELRKKIKEDKGEYYVSKKTLLELAFRDRKISDLDIKSFGEQVAAVFGYEDEVGPAKVIYDFKKTNEEKVKFLGGILENKYLKEEEVEELAQIPSKNELYAKIVGSINAPVSGFVNALSGNLKNLVYVLKAVEEKKA